MYKRTATCKYGIISRYCRSSLTVTGLHIEDSLYQGAHCRKTSFKKTVDKRRFFRLLDLFNCSNTPTKKYDDFLKSVG